MTITGSTSSQGSVKSQSNRDIAMFNSMLPVQSMRPHHQAERVAGPCPWAMEGEPLKATRWRSNAWSSAGWHQRAPLRPLPKSRSVGPDRHVRPRMQYSCHRAHHRHPTDFQPGCWSAAA